MIIYLTVGFISGAGIVILVLYSFFKNPEKFEKCISLIAQWGSLIFKKAEYLATKTFIQSRINMFVSTLELHTSANFPRVSLRWAMQDGEDEIILEEGQAILIMRDRKNNTKNLIHAAYFFTSESLLKKTERHLTENQKTSINLFSTLQILIKENKSAADQFQNEYIVPELEKNDSLREYLRQYNNIDKTGIFFPIFIQELWYLGRKIFLDKPTIEVKREIKALADFLEKFSNRQIGELINLDFFGRYMRCRIFIVASKDLRECGFSESYVLSINKAIQKKYENFYIIGSAEKENIKFIDEVAKAVISKNTNVEIVRNCTFRGRIVRDGLVIPVVNYLVHFHNSNAVTYLYNNSDIL
ncbi:MAG: hypothetical protein WC878_06240 [Candidatus Paceibacterota bacterium]|jgi:hypothetical protein